MSEPKKNRRPVKITEKKPRTKLTPTNEEMLKVLLADNAQVVEQMAILKRKQDENKARIFEIVATLDGADETWEGEGEDKRVHRATVVRPASTVYNTDVLEHTLPPRLWRAITDTVLNVKAMEEAVADGRLDADVVLEARSEEPKKPYVRITTK